MTKYDECSMFMLTEIFNNIFTSDKISDSVADYNEDL